MTTNIMSYGYAYEKLMEAERGLAIGGGDVRFRLLAAHMCFHTLSEEDFPGYLRRDFPMDYG